MTDKNYNKWLEVKNKARRFLGIKGNDVKSFFPYSTIHTFAGMSDEKLESLYYKTQPWGMYHPEQLHMWFDKDGTKLTNDGVEFSVTYNRFNLPTGGSIPNGIGIIVSKEGFGYGTYEWRVKLPGGSGLWPAVWLAGKTIWPPEIDVFEAYSGDDGYGERVESNLWLGVSPNEFDAKALRHGYVLNEKDYFDLVLEYDKDCIKIYYNGYLVRRVTDKEVMKWYANNPDMVVIMGTGIRAGKSLNPTYPMVVERFIYSKNPNY